MTTPEIGGEGLGWVNGSGQRQHGRKCQGRKSCLRSVGVRNVGGNQQQGHQGMETADRSKGVGVWDAQSLGRQHKDFVCGSTGVWDGRSVREGKPLVLVLP